MAPCACNKNQKMGSFGRLGEKNRVIQHVALQLVNCCRGPHVDQPVYNNAKHEVRGKYHPDHTTVPNLFVHIGLSALRRGRQPDMRERFHEEEPAPGLCPWALLICWPLGPGITTQCAKGLASWASILAWHIGCALRALCAQQVVSPSGQG